MEPGTLGAANRARAPSNNSPGKAAKDARVSFGLMARRIAANSGEPQLYPRSRTGFGFGCRRKGGSTRRVCSV